MSKSITVFQNGICSNMRISIKMYIVVITAASLALYQYQLVKAWMSLLCNCKQSKGMHIGNISKSTKQDIMIEINVTNSPCFRSPQLALDLPPLYIITPTYRRPEQLADLTRLSHTLMLVPNVHWLVIEDSEKKTPVVTELLQRTGLRFQHLTAPMPENYKRSKMWPKPKGVSNRNRGLSWIRANASEGVLYFADDDNSYDLKIFHEMRFTKRVSMWPVGLITKLGVSSPIVRNGLFVGFYDGWIAGRKFPVDMAGFAVAVKFLLQRPKALMPYRPGYEEDGFLKSLRPFEPTEIELLASKCSTILVWHTQTKKNEPSRALDVHKYNNTNIVALKKILV